MFFTILLVYIRWVPDDVTFGALAVPSRRQLLQTLRASDAPLDVPALATATGLHPNTVRFHLDVLLRTGFVEEQSDRRGTRGRPRTVYTVTLPGVHNTGYELLAEILVTHLDTVGDGVAAEHAGRAWAKRLRPDDSALPQDLDATTTMILALFTEMGFDPEVVIAGDMRRMMLRACPFWTLAEKHPGVVCALHLGLLRGLVEQATHATVEAGLTPFVQPRLCEAELATAGTAHKR
jgi:predicted ArsR family transcriptional regulator